MFQYLSRNLQNFDTVLINKNVLCFLSVFHSLLCVSEQANFQQRELLYSVTVVWFTVPTQYKHCERKV